MDGGLVARAQSETLALSPAALSAVRGFAAKELTDAAEEIRQATETEVLPVRCDLSQASDIERLVRSPCNCLPGSLWQDRHPGG